MSKHVYVSKHCRISSGMEGGLFQLHISIYFGFELEVVVVF